jgi:hypothetical protein
MANDIGAKLVPPPSASGARLVGDDLQHLIGWYWALKTMRPEFEIDTVTFESLNAGNLDDIEVHRTGGGVPEFWQVKASTSSSEPVTSDWLKTPVSKTAGSLLQRFWKSYLELRERHGDVSLVLATNRSLDTTDPVLKCRDQNELLAPILRRKGRRTEAAKGLKVWAGHIGISEAELLEMLDVLRFRTDVTESGFREKVSDVIKPMGLRSDEASMLAGIGTVRNWIKSSRVARTGDDVARVIKDLNFRVAPPSGLLVIQAVAACDDTDATASLDWVDRFMGDDARTRRGLKDPTEWNARLRAELRVEIARVRVRYDRVSIAGQARLPIWFTVGAELSEVTGATIATTQLGDVWASDAPSSESPELVMTDPRSIGAGRGIAITVAVSDDVTADVLAFVERDLSTVGAHRTITLATGPNSRAIHDAGEAVAFARRIKEMVRDLVRTEQSEMIHLFLAMPHGLALLLGHVWDRMPPTQLYEDMTGSTYQPAFLITNRPNSESD